MRNVVLVVLALVVAVVLWRAVGEERAQGELDHRCRSVLTVDEFEYCLNQTTLPGFTRLPPASRLAIVLNLAETNIEIMSPSYYHLSPGDKARVDELYKQAVASFRKGDCASTAKAASEILELVPGTFGYRGSRALASYCRSQSQ